MWVTFLAGIKSDLAIGSIPRAALRGSLNEVHPGHKHAQQVLEAFEAEGRDSSSSGRSGEAPVPILKQRKIAAKLYIATETVKTHLQNIYGKLDAKGRVAALKEARGLGLIPNN